MRTPLVLAIIAVAARAWGDCQTSSECAAQTGLNVLAELVRGVSRCRERLESRPAPEAPGGLRSPVLVDPERSRPDATRVDYPPPTRTPFEAKRKCLVTERWIPGEWVWEELQSKWYWANGRCRVPPSVGMTYQAAACTSRNGAVYFCTPSYWD